VVNSDVPLLVCVSADVDVRERVVRQLGDCGAVLICADLDELRAMLFPTAVAVAPQAAPMAMLAGGPTASGGHGGLGRHGGLDGHGGPGAADGCGAPGVAEAEVIADGPARTGAPGSGSPAVPQLAQARPDGVVSIGELVIDPAGHLVVWRGQPLPLTRLERELLGRLATPPVSVWTYQRLFDVVWGKAYLGDTSILHSAVKRLRGKLRTAGDGLCVETVRGVGYRLAVLC
jgi:hypothetical protein